MTNEEAIKILKLNVSSESGGFYKVAVELAIRALRKQIPQKAKAEYIAQGGVITCFETHVCPNCDRNLYDEAGTTVYYDYCPDCGQALDWSDDE